VKSGDLSKEAGPKKKAAGIADGPDFLDLFRRRGGVY